MALLQVPRQLISIRCGSGLVACRYLGDPAGQAQFVAERLELAAVQAAEGPGAAAALVADKGSSRPSTSSSASVLGRFGYYNAWALLDLLLAEWLSRAWARAQGMVRLRRCVKRPQWLLDVCQIWMHAGIWMYWVAAGHVTHLRSA